MTTKLNIAGSWNTPWANACLARLESYEPRAGHLDLSRLALSDADLHRILPTIGGLPQLRSLDLHRNDLCDGALRGIASALPKLTELVLWGNRIHDEGICAAIHELAHLRHLDLGLNPIGDSSAIRIAETLPGVRVLSVGMTRVTTRGVAYLAARMHQLRTLKLRQIVLQSDAICGLVAHGSRLTQLDVSCADINARRLRELVAGLPQLESLEISDNPIGGHGAAALQKLALRLHVLSAKRIGLTGAEISDSLRQASLLTSLAISDMPMSSEDVESLVASLPALDCLTMSRCSLSAKSIEHVITHIPAVRNLDLGGNRHIGDSGAARAGECLHNLESLRINSCGLVSADAVLSLNMKLPRLQRLYVAGNRLRWSSRSPAIPPSLLNEQDPLLLSGSLRYLKHQEEAQRVALGQLVLLEPTDHDRAAICNSLSIAASESNTATIAESDAFYPTLVAAVPAQESLRLKRVSNHYLLIDEVSCCNPRLLSVGRRSTFTPSWTVFLLPPPNNGRARAPNVEGWLTLLRDVYAAHGRACVLLPAAGSSGTTNAGARKMQVADDSIEVVLAYSRHTSGSRTVRDLGAEGWNSSLTQGLLDALRGGPARRTVIVPREFITLVTATREHLEWRTASTHTSDVVVDTTDRFLEWLITSCGVQRDRAGTVFSLLLELGVLWLFGSDLESGVYRENGNADVGVSRAQPDGPKCQYVASPQSFSALVAALGDRLSNEATVGFVSREEVRRAMGDLGLKERSSTLGCLVAAGALIPWCEDAGTIDVLRGFLIPSLLPECQREDWTSWHDSTCEAEIAFNAQIDENRILRFVAGRRVGPQCVLPVVKTRPEHGVRATPKMYRNEIAFRLNRSDVLVHIDQERARIALQVRGPDETANQSVLEHVLTEVTWPAVENIHFAVERSARRCESVSDPHAFARLRAALDDTALVLLECLSRGPCTVTEWVKRPVPALRRGRTGPVGRAISALEFTGLVDCVSKRYSISREGHRFLNSLRREVTQKP